MALLKQFKMSLLYFFLFCFVLCFFVWLQRKHCGLDSVLLLVDAGNNCSKMWCTRPLEKETESCNVYTYGIDTLFSV